MDLATVIGLIMGFAAIFGGAFLEGLHMTALIQPTAAMIVLGGTFGATFICFPLASIIKAFKDVKIVFLPPKVDHESVVKDIINYATKARRNGLISLEQEAQSARDPFIKKGISLVVDGIDPQKLRETLEADIMAFEDHSKHSVEFYESAGGFAPTIGIIGAVLGLIHVMSNLSDTSKLGGGIAVAFVATIYGLMVANIICLPIGTKLKIRMKEEVLRRVMILEGLIAIQNGENPHFIEQKLKAYAWAATTDPPMALKKEPEKHVNHERWLVSYADFITLLFAVFVTLYAMSQSDKKKVEEVVQSIQQSFGMIQSGAPSPKMNVLPSKQLSVSPSIKPEIAVAPGSRTARGQFKTRADEKDFRQIKSSIEAYLVKQGAQSKVSLTITRRGLIVSLKEAGFFESGHAQIKPAAYDLINTIAEPMTQYNNPLRLEGHTDNIPISSAQYPSNWELSTARAVNGLKYLISHFDVDPDKVSATGYAEFRPLADNATPEGRAKNRRVDLVMLSGDGERGEP